MALWIKIKSERGLAKYTKNLGENILIAKASQDIYCLVGYIKVDERLAYFALNGQVVRKNEFSMFVINGRSRYFSWYYLREGESLPPKSYMVGHDYRVKSTFIGKTTVNGEELYGRVNILSDEPVLSIATKSDGVVFAYSFYILLYEADGNVINNE
ncbi:Hypothetical predicted protein [Cloeon dipterum]|uniref:Uncharacterized protein n=1 Tax=Cloeon dipterum TaxID=197152 RepID=A0A8S1D3V2_9INSE|nr:Hypothetical predicted protein [Cloeon dipterum]